MSRFFNFLMHTSPLCGECSVDAESFRDRCKDDRHHFRFVVSPEDAEQMTDLKAYTRELVSRMESDLGTKLDWVAVDHYDTAQSHTHLLVRGVRDDGKDLVMPRAYISHGIRERAQEIASLELGLMGVPPPAGGTCCVQLDALRRISRVVLETDR